MAATYRLEKLNEVQYAYDESRRAELEAKGFKVVGKTEEAAEPENFEAEGVHAAAEAEELAEAEDSLGKSGSSKKAARKPKGAGGEDKNA